MTKLTDTQLIVLSAASQREDHLLTPPENLKGAAARNLATKLVTLGLVEAVAVGRDQPAWRTDEDRRLGLKITPAGLIAIGIELEEYAGDGDPVGDAVPPPGPHEPASTGSEPRHGSKQALIVSLLQREDGATLDDLVRATGWLPHTGRAALTGLRRKGYDLIKRKRADGKTVYVIGGEQRCERGGAPGVAAAGAEARA